MVSKAEQAVCTFPLQGLMGEFWVVQLLEC
jgi:hypothetical protein